MKVRAKGTNTMSFIKNSIYLKIDLDISPTAGWYVSCEKEKPIKTYKVNIRQGENQISRQLQHTQGKFTHIKVVAQQNNLNYGRKLHDISYK